MSKNFSLREHLSISEAAEYLSEELSFEVNSTDLVDLATNNRIQLSLRLQESSLARISPENNSYVSNSSIEKRIEEIESLPLYIIPAKTYELAMSVTNAAAIKAKLIDKESNPSADSLIHLPIALVSKKSQRIAYLYKNMWGELKPKVFGGEIAMTIISRYVLKDEKYYFYPQTQLPDKGEILIATTELQRFAKRHAEKEPRVTPKYKIEDKDNLPSKQTEGEDNALESKLEPSSRKEEALLKTIGALAKLAAHLGGNDVGTFDKPNAKALREKLMELDGDSLPYGLGESSWIDRISKGRNTYDKSKN